MSKIYIRLISLSMLVSMTLLFLTTSVTKAAESGLFFGQSHSYTVVFRGNGEAISFAKVVVTNPSEKPMDDFRFEIPSVSPTEMAIYQMKLPKQCVNYDYKYSERSCLKYAEPDYSQRYYGGGNSLGEIEYKKIEFDRRGDSYTLKLPTPVESFKTTAIIIAYAAKGYVKVNMGLHKFNFETIKVPSRIQDITVAVDVDSDLVLKGKKSSVNYDTKTSADSLATMSGSSVSSPELDRIVGNIGSYGPIVKEAKNLAPNESFLVKGEYATSWSRLYLGSIIITVVIMLGIILGIYFLARFLKKRHDKNKETELVSETQQTPRSQGSIGDVLNVANVLAGLISAVSLCGVTFLLTLISNSEMLYSFRPGTFFGLIIVITIFLMYVLIIIGPAVFMAVKHGWKALVVVLFMEFLWLIFFMIIYFILFQTGLTNFLSRDPYPMDI